MVVSFCTAIAYSNTNIYNIRIAIGVALRCCNLSLVAVRSNFRSVSAKNEGNSHLDGMRAKEKTNTSPYGIHLFRVLFYALSRSLVFIYTVSHRFVSITLFMVDIWSTQAFAICALACFSHSLSFSFAWCVSRPHTQCCFFNAILLSNFQLGRGTRTIKVTELVAYIWRMWVG